MVEFPDGTTMQACGLLREGDPEPDVGLYLDQRWDQAWLHDYIDRPGSVPPSELEAAVDAIGAAFDRARLGERVGVGCFGGLGLTGTALACMAVHAGVSGHEAVAWVRANYRGEAVESSAQVELRAASEGRA